MTRARSAARERILATADTLFYGEGVRAVGVDRVVEESKVARVTFYRHFPSKNDLVVAYIDGRLDGEQTRLQALRAAHPDDSREVLREVGRIQSERIKAPGFRGCPYLNVCNEFADPAHPARQATSRHRVWIKAQIESLLTEMNHPRVFTTMEQLIMLRAGAMSIAAGYGVEPITTTVFLDAWNELIR
jgi:AcrR family transcriptional regulator